MSSDESESVDSTRSEISILMEDVTDATEAFAKRLVEEVKSFIRNTSTSRDAIRAMIRCLGKCIETLNDDYTTHTGGLVLKEAVARPAFDNAQTLSRDELNDELRSRARKLVKYLKTQTLEEFVSALHPRPNASSEEAKEALSAIKSSVHDCNLLLDRVMYEGFDCRSSTEEDDVEDEDEDDDDDE